MSVVDGGAADRSSVERVHATTEAEYWRKNYQTRPYYQSSYDFETDYAPAYIYGSDARVRYVGRQWDDSLDHDLGHGWDQVKGKSRLIWIDAKDAAHDAWERDDRTDRTDERTDLY